MLAARLTEDPGTSVLLVEAGPSDRKLEIKIPAAFSRLYASAVDWGYRTAPQAALDGREVLFPLGKVLGGSALCQRDDGSARAPPRPGGLGRSRLGVERCGALLRAQRIGGLPLDRTRAVSPLSEAFVEAAVGLGMRRRDLNDPDNEGVGLVPTSTRRGRRHSVADGYLRPALRPIEPHSAGPGPTRHNCCSTGTARRRCRARARRPRRGGARRTGGDRGRGRRRIADAAPALGHRASRRARGCRDRVHRGQSACREGSLRPPRERDPRCDRGSGDALHPQNGCGISPAGSSSAEAP